MEKPKSIPREKLYEEVWKTPGRQLAERYGVSDVALSKICRKMSVPRPYRGYWRRIESGQRPKPTRLPRAKANTVLVHEFTRRDSKSIGSRSITSKQKPELRNPIVVPERLTNPHPLIRISRDELKKRSDFSSWDRVYFSRCYLSVIVHPKAAGRAYRIMDSLLKAIETRGHEVGISEGYYGGGCAIIFGQEIRFDLRDRDCSLSGDDVPYAAPFAWSWEEGPARLRKGLVFRVYKSWACECGTRHWRDGKRQRLEDLLDEILLYMLHLARCDRHYEVRIEKREREREVRERIQLQREAVIAAEKQRQRNLMCAARSWGQSTHLREFIKALEAKLGDGNSECREILEWARSVADEIDPLQRSPQDLVNLLRMKLLPSGSSGTALTAK